MKKLALLACAVVALSGSAHAATLYVSAGAHAGGKGSKAHPFASLQAVEEASQPGDTIMIEPSSGPALDGGIALKPGQSLIGDGPPVLQSAPAVIDGGPTVWASAGRKALPRLTNSSGARNSGDAVELANDTTVRNLVIPTAFRGDIYGMDVKNVSVTGNDVAGQNTSKTFGFVVQPFFLETYTPFVARSTTRAATLKAGWATIMIDQASVVGAADISGNYVHDSFCGDGIDVRGMGTGGITVKMDHNFIARLIQCDPTRAVQAISTQVVGTSTLHAVLTNNSIANSGSPGADAEGIFVNPAEGGTLTETIDNNVYLNGIGGASTNGLEYILGNGSAQSSVVVTNSIFRGNPGDMLEEFNRGEFGSTQSLTLDHVTVENTTISNGNAPFANPPGKAGSPDNTGECFGIGSVGANDKTLFTMTNSTFTGCDNNGIEVTNNYVKNDGDGFPALISLYIDHSRISGSRYYNLYFTDLTPLTTLQVRVQNSDLTTSKEGIVAAFDQQPTGTLTNAQIDLGGGALGSVGQNCISGGALFDVETNAYKIAAQHNWWGQPGGPAPAHVSAPGLDSSSPLAQAPAACTAPQNLGR